MKNYILIAFLVISNSLFSQGLAITVTGDWSPVINISEAGNDYPIHYESLSSQTLLTINPKNMIKDIYVYVTRNDIVWNSSLTLKIRHTSTNMNIRGGVDYQTITNVTPPSSVPNLVAELFTYSGTAISVPLQYEITGISVLLPVDSYSTIITYTVMYD